MKELSYCILGLLLRQPSTGYELAKIFKGRVGEFFNVKYSQIYPKLNNMKDYKLIEYHIDLRGSSLKRKRYYVTDSGKEKFNRWINSVQSPIIGPTSNSFLSRLFFSELQSLDEHIALVKAYRKESSENLKRMEDCRFLYNKTPSYGETLYGDYLILEHLISCEKSFYIWITEHLSHLVKIKTDMLMSE